MAPSSFLFAPIIASASGATAVVPLDPFKTITVWKYVVVASGAVGVQFAGGATALTGSMPIGASGSGLVGQFDGVPHFQAPANQPLNVVLSGAVAVGGYVCYTIGNPA